MQTRVVIQWSREVFPPGKILYPQTTEQLKGIIRVCRKNNHKIKIMTDPNEPIYETDNLRLVSLKEYQLPVRNIHHNDEALRLYVNAGMSIKEVSDYLKELNPKFVFETTSNQMSIAHAIYYPIAGNFLGKFFLGDLITQLIIVSDRGNVEIKSRGDEGFRRCIYSMGTGGIITKISITLEPEVLSQVGFIRCPNIRNYPDIDIEGYISFIIDGLAQESNLNFASSGDLTTSLPEEELLSPIEKSSSSNVILDYHNKSLHPLPERRHSQSDILINVSRKKRWSIRFFRSPRRWYLKYVGRTITKTSQEGDYEDYRHLLEEISTCRVYSMRYYIPIPEETKKNKRFSSQILNLSDEMTEEIKFRPEFPILLSLITPHHSSLIYSTVASTPSRYYLDIEIFFNLDKHEKYDQDFYLFFQNLEARWIKLGGIPVLGRASAFGEDHPYQNDDVVKKGIREDFVLFLGPHIQHGFMTTLQEKLYWYYRNLNDQLISSR